MKQKLFLTALFLVNLLSTSAQNVFNVEVSDFQFSPLIFSVQVGDTIRWNWAGGAHTTTSTVLPPGADSWDAPITSSNTFYKYVPNVAGTYFYKCTPHSSSGMTGKFYVFALSVNKPNNQVAFTIYPNPVSSHLFIKFDDINKPALLSITDINGRLIAKREFIGLNTATIDISNVANGVYIISVEQNGSRHVQKMTVVH